MRITINFSFGSGIFVYEKSHVTASAYQDLRKPNTKGKVNLFSWKPFFSFYERFLWINDSMNECLSFMNEWMNEWVNEWTNEWVNEWMDKWMVDQL